MWGLALRHLFLYRESWPRLFEMMYWPIINISLFGFISLSMVQRFGHTDILTETYLGGLLLAELLTRTVMAFLVMYMEEVWSRNLGHLFASPVRIRDYVGSLMILSATRCLIAIVPAYVIAYFLFNFSILSLGWALPLYGALLCFNGWWYGIMIISLLMRFGLAAEWLGWMGTWVLMPFMAPYYPVSILPHAFQIISWTLPGTYVFECMKQQMVSGSINYSYLAISAGLNVLYLILACVIFSRSYLSAQNLGGLLQMGE